MEDLKLEEDDATPATAAQGPSPFAAGPLPRTLFFRETGVSPWRARGKRVVVTSSPPRPQGNRRLHDEVVEEVDSEEEQGLIGSLYFITSSPHFHRLTLVDSKNSEGIHKFRSIHMAVGTAHT